MSVETTRAWLHALRESSLRWEDLPPAVRELTRAYAHFMRRKEERVGHLASEVILEVWKEKIRNKLRESDNPRAWIKALIPVLQYLYPVLIQSGRLQVEEILQMLREGEGVRNFVGEADRPAGSMEEVSPIVSRISREAEGLSKRVYYKWQREGIERLEDALEKAYQDLQAGTPIEVILPALGKHRGRIQPNLEVSLLRDRQPLPDLLPSSYVERPRELGKLREAIASVAEKGGWVSVEGLPGIGKSTLVRALIRQFTEEATLPGNLREVAYAQSEFPVHSPRDDGLNREIWSLVRHLAGQLGVYLDERSLARSLEVFRQALARKRVLIVVDNLANYEVVGWLKDLPAGVVGVAVTRYPEAVEPLQPCCRLEVHGLESGEAEELVGKVAGPVPREQQEAMEALLRTVEYHPLAVRLLAEAARQTGWEHLKAGLLENSHLPDDPLERINVILAEAIERIDGVKGLLLPFGQLPLFAVWDVEAGAVLWKVPKEMAGRYLERLVEAGLMGKVSWKDRVYYRLHWLIWNYARKRKRGRLLCWALKYALEEVIPTWRWWRPVVPGTRWPWPPWHIPGTEGQKGVVPIIKYLLHMAWRSSEGYLLVTPAEVALCVRRSFQFWCFFLPLSIVTVILSCFGPLPPAFQVILAILLGLVVITLFFSVVEQWYVALWRARGQTPPPFVDVRELLHP